MSSTSRQRRYGGKTAEQRHVERRTALLDAGRELWAEHGWAAVTMRGVCARAGLGDRYFYESFADRDQLLVAIGQSVRDEVLGVIVTAVAQCADAEPMDQLHAALDAIVRQIEDDPGATQIFFGDHGGSEVLESLRREMIATVVDLFLELARPHLLPGAAPTELRVSLLIGIGGFVETAAAWRSGAFEATSEELVTVLITVARRLATGLFAIA